MKREARVITDYDGQRRVALVAESRVSPEPVPMASHADGVVRDGAGKVVARDPELVRYDGRAKTEVSYVERDGGPASAQVYRPVVDVVGPDEAGRPAQFQRRSTVLEYLHRAGDITDAQIRAVRWLAAEIEEAQLGTAIQVVDWERVGSGFDPAKALGPTGGDLSLMARRNVQAALRALYWPDSLGARLLVYTIATGGGVAGWQDQAGDDPAKRKHKQYLVGVLVGAVVQLDIWYRQRA